MPHGTGKTAVHKDQLDWGEDYQNRHGILKLFNKPRDHADPKTSVGALMYKGLIVLDWEEMPVKEFEVLPLTIAGTIQGFRIETWKRLDIRITTHDIAARLPVKEKSDAGIVSFVPELRDTTIMKRAGDFRDNNGLVSWARTGKIKEVYDYMNSLRTADQKANNLAIDHLLDRKERKGLRGQNARKNMISRSGKGRGAEEVPAGTSNHDEATMKSGAEGLTEMARVQEAILEPEVEAHLRPMEDDDAESMTYVEERPAGTVQNKDEPMDYFDGYRSEEDDTEDSDDDDDDNIDQEDSRFDIPTSAIENRAIRDALHYTILDFEARFRRRPIVIDFWLCYIDHWQFIQNLMVLMSDVLGHQNPPPMQILDKWTGGVENWRSAKIFLHGQE